MAWAETGTVTGEEQGYEEQGEAVVNTIPRIKLAQMQELVPRWTLDIWTPIGELILLKDYLLILFTYPAHNTGQRTK